MSALPPKADIPSVEIDVRKVPEADINAALCETFLTSAAHDIVPFAGRGASPEGSHCRPNSEKCLLGYLVATLNLEAQTKASHFAGFVMSDALIAYQRVQGSSPCALTIKINDLRDSLFRASGLR